MRLERFLGNPLVSDSLLQPKRTWEKGGQFRQIFPPSETKTPLPFDNHALTDRDHIKLGHYCACAKVSVDGESPLAVKVHLPPRESLPTDTDPSINEEDLAFQMTLNDRNEYERLRKGPLGSFVPETHFVIGNGIDGGPAQINIQRWAGDKAVGEMSMKEILENPFLLYSLNAFIRGFLVHSLSSGERIEYAGFGMREGASILDRINMVSIFASRNLVWNGEELSLVDITTHSQKRKYRFLHLLKYPVILRDYLIASAALSVQQRTIPESRRLDEFVGGFSEIIERMEVLRKQYGIDYRVVGGVAAAAIIGETLTPCRGDGSRRDVDIIVLNPDACPQELSSLNEWVAKSVQLRLFFPDLAISKTLTSMLEPDGIEEHKGERLPNKWIFQARLCRIGDNSYVRRYGRFFIPIPRAALEPTYFEFHGVKFPSFPSWFHYFLYVTRNGGYIKRCDREKVTKLREIACSSSFGPGYLEDVESFLERLRKHHQPEIMKNAVRLETSWVREKFRWIKYLRKIVVGKPQHHLQEETTGDFSPVPGVLR